MSGNIGTIQPYVTIDTQKWQRRNLDVSTYRNGDPIPYVADTTAWTNLTTGAWCWYNNNPELGKIYGKLYNGHAVRDSRGLAPEGWHIPTNAEWNTLEIYLNNNSNLLKEVGTSHWTSNPNATNSTKFTALGNGSRNNSGVFADLKNYGTFWTSTYNSSTQTLTYRFLFYNDSSIWTNTIGNQKAGYSVRCIKD